MPSYFLGQIYKLTNSRVSKSETRRAANGIKLDCVGLGFNCVDLLIRIPQMPSFKKHRHTHVLNFDMQGGGPVSTGLVAMARLGAKVGYVGKVGDDQWGDFIRQEYIKYGVKTSRLTVEKGKTSNCSFVLVEADTGERVFMVSPSSLSPLELTQDDRKYIANSRLLFLDAGGHAMIEAAQIAKDHEIPALLDGLATGKLRGLVDIAICGEEMACRTAKTTDAHEALEKLYPNGYKTLGITLGSKGSIFKAGKETHVQKAFAVEVVDTTGAGDVFHGAFAYGTLQGWSIEKTAEFASAVSALKCTRLGGRSGIPSLQDTAAFLKNRDSAFF